MYYDEFMNRAIFLASESISDASLTPFGAVVVYGGKIIGEGQSTVIKDCDCTAHAEINAIRSASQCLDSHLLSGADIYCSGFPCPLCLSAIRWANIENVYYAATLEDSSKVGFEDLEYYRDLQSFNFDRIGDVDLIAANECNRVRSVKVLRHWKTRFDRGDG